MAPQAVSGNINSLDPQEFLKCMEQLSIKEIDTSARYQNGESEKIIGRNHLGDHLAIDTKILVTDNAVNGHLTPDKIEKSLNHSLEVLQIKKINILYCHLADFETPIPVQARAFDKQYREGKFTALGFSNFPPSMIREWLNVADKEGLVKPSYYQGQYNLLCRGYETEQLPLLKEHGIHFVAFSPLAGGFLMGKVSRTEKVGARYTSAASPYASWYDRPAMHDALDKLREIASANDTQIEALSLRWLFYPSALRDTDMVLVGGSKIEHYEQTMALVKQGPLKGSVAQELSRLYDICGKEANSIVEHKPK